MHGTMSWFAFQRNTSCVDRNPNIPGGGGTPDNGLYGEAPPEMVPFSVFRYIKG